MGMEEEMKEYKGQTVTNDESDKEGESTIKLTRSSVQFLRQ